jgi:hypothetical protein
MCILGIPSKDTSVVLEVPRFNMFTVGIPSKDTSVVGEVPRF